MNKPITVTEATFEAEIAKSAKPVLIDLWAPWCGPCRMLGPIVDEIAAEHGDRFKVTKIDVDHDPALAAKFGVRSIPTLLFFEGGQLRGQIVGLASKSTIIARLESLALPPATV